MVLLYWPLAASIVASFVYCGFQKLDDSADEKGATGLEETDTK